MGIDKALRTIMSFLRFGTIIRIPWPLAFASNHKTHRPPRGPSWSHGIGYINALIVPRRILVVRAQVEGRRVVIRQALLARNAVLYGSDIVRKRHRICMNPTEGVVRGIVGLFDWNGTVVVEYAVVNCQDTSS